MSELQVIFSANLAADFELMPYVATTIRQARQQPSTAEPRPTLLLDLGGAWSDEVWVSATTEHRAPYLILDAMGYSVARADGLDVGGILGLRNSVQMFLMDDSIVYRWQSYGVEVNVGPRASAPFVTWPAPMLAPAFGQTIYQQQDGGVILRPLTGEIGKIVADYPSMQVVEAERIAIRRNRPDPSIVEMVKFVEWEARAYEARQKGKDEA